MKRVVLTAALLALATAALLAATLRVVECADCLGTPWVFCSRCHGGGRITWMNRALRPPPDPDLLRLLTCEHTDMMAAPGIYHESLSRLLSRWRRQDEAVSFLLGGSAIWTSPETAAVLVPATLEGGRFYLVGRDGSLLDEAHCVENYLSDAVKARFDGHSIQVRLGYPVGEARPDHPPRTLMLREGGRERRFRVPSAALPTGTLLVRWGVESGRFETLELGEGLKELAAGDP